MSRYIILIIIFVTASIAYSQDRVFQKGNKKYDKFAYIDAIKVYEQVAEKGYSSAELFKKLGNANYFNANLPEATKWYSKLFDIDSTDIEVEYYFRYAQSLKGLKEYKKSDIVMKKFFTLTNIDSPDKYFKTKQEYSTEIKVNSEKFRIQNSSINSPNSDFAPSYYNDNLVFSSAKNSSIVSQYIHSWNNKPFLNLYSATISEDSRNLLNVKPFSKQLNTRFHESAACFTKDGNTIYFTRNNYTKGKLGRDNLGVNKLKIYRSRLKNGVWSKPEELDFNSDHYSVAHPALSIDEKELYFASDMPGTLGKSDLYKVKINEDGSFGKPKNLGQKVNTIARDTYPFISDSGILYFSSIGHAGLGGLDIYAVQLKENNKFGKVYNLGKPINSEYDDFSFIINSQTNLGYFASNRKGGIGDDDIYSFVRTSVIKASAEQQLRGIINNQDTNSPIVGAKVLLKDINNSTLATTYTNLEGAFSFDYLLNSEEQYFVRVSKENYSTIEHLIPIEKDKSHLKLVLMLKKEILKIEENDDISYFLNIPIIYFDYNKSNIRDDASVELAKIIVVLKQNPNLHLDIKSHTDSRGNNAYNMLLSNLRNKATINWIIEKGEIDPDRLTGKGYGETQLINHCRNGVHCSEKEHEQNRRSEFIVMKH